MLCRRLTLAREACRLLARARLARQSASRRFPCRRFRLFGEAAKAAPEPVIDVKTLLAKIGEVTPPLGDCLQSPAGRQEHDFCPARSARRVCCPVARQHMHAFARVGRKK